MKAIIQRSAVALVTCLVCISAPATALAQAPPPGSQSFLADYSRGPSWFPVLFKPYQEQAIPVMTLENSPRLRDLIRDGRLELSLSDALAKIGYGIQITPMPDVTPPTS